MATTNGQLDTAISIVTPENISFQYRLAGPFRRFYAFVVDLALRIGVFMLLSFLMSLLSMIVGAVSLAGLLLIWFVMEWFYGGLFETFWNGRTPGKWLLGIRVLSADGRPINGFQAILRNLLRLVDFFPLVPLGYLIGIPELAIPLPTFLVGLFSMTLTRSFRRLGDLVCGTIVVIDERSWHAGLAKLDDARAIQLATYLPTDLQVSRSMARAIAHYVERRKYFSTPRRREVARHLGKPLLERFHLPAETSHDLLLCSMYYRLFIADRGQDETFLEASSRSPFAHVRR